jgi:type 1 glutamine amidotransferase
MKLFFMKPLFLTSLLAAVFTLQTTLPLAAADAPKKLLVVTTTTGFRHSSIPTLEKVIAQLGKDSGAFTVDLVQQPPGQPNEVRKPAPLNADATDEQKAAFQGAQDRYTAFLAARDKWNAAMKAALQKLSPESLKNYDAVAFVSTTGELPIPDPQGLLDWIKAGHAFIGIHAASDTFHRWPAYIDMLGGEFEHHGAQLGVECLNQDPQHPATAHLGKTWTITQEEMYQFKNYDPAKVHDLLILDKKPQAPFTPGHFPVSWCKPFGNGKVFYTSLGHREDIIDADPNLKGRINSMEISKAYQAHVLGGIKWALGLKTVPVQ